MNVLKITFTALVVSLVLTGCSATKNLLAKRSDGSLDYQSSQKLDPIKLPADQVTGNFIPLYPTVELGDNQLDLKNSSGKQYQLPAPPSIH
ncbi:hypothetical protein LU293_04660 [Moraxella nasovis]|uniref:hypothetical protein n=1 Tax=Moraxella nasovis TaxID=2904121 RepID=UPI001F60A2AE|nr:hypothetical protein [Moraxella nasovis]UNU74188.1 hypothetical protein LU293_04660 [Moraxella nasovis]